MPRMFTTQELAARYGVTPQAINKYRRKVEEIERDRTGNEGFKLGSPDTRDARKVVFTETEAEMISEMIPQSILESQPINGEVVEEDDRIVQSHQEDRQAVGLLPFNFTQVNLTINQTSTQHLQDETANIRHQGTFAIGVLKDAFSAHAKGRILEGLGQIDHAAAALTTSALIDAVQEVQSLQQPRQKKGGKASAAKSF